MTVTLPVWTIHLAVFLAAFSAYLYRAFTPSVEGGGMFSFMGEGIKFLLDTVFFLMYMVAHLLTALLILST
jgi:hypothetical protein